MGSLSPCAATIGVLIIDCKRNDKLVASVGKAVTEIPPKTWPTRKREPFDMWFRLCVHDQFTSEGRGKPNFRSYNAMHRVYNEGEWIVYFDEIQDVGGIRQPTSVWECTSTKCTARAEVVTSPYSLPRRLLVTCLDRSMTRLVGHGLDGLRMRIDASACANRGMPRMHSHCRRVAKARLLLAANDGEEFMRTRVKVSAA